MDTQIDPQVKNLVSAIGRAETGNPSPEAYSKQGASGEFGRYQFMPDTWNEWTKEAKLDPNDKSIEAQNKVAYNKVKQWKEQGLTPAQIASKWNSGDENKYKQQWKGEATLKDGTKVAYDTPAYAQKVSQFYRELSGGQNTQPQQQTFEDYLKKSSPNGQNQEQNNIQQSQQPTENNLIQDLSQRGQEFGTGLSSIIGGKEKTGQTRLSGLIQGVGALAGGLGDVVGKGLELIPGVKAIESVIGQGASKFAQTSVGQHIFKSIQDFQQSNPELAKDIGAGFNILTAIPILKGFSVLGKVGLDATSVALKSTAQKVMAKDLAQVAKVEVADVLPMVEKDVLPTIKEGKWSIDEAIKTLDNKLKIGEVSVNEHSVMNSILAKIKDKEVKLGAIREALKNYATTAGAGIGASIGGTPGAIVGGLAGRATGKFAESKLGNITSGILKRASKGAKRQTLKDITKGVGKGSAGLLGQKINK